MSQATTETTIPTIQAEYKPALRSQRKFLEETAIICIYAADSPDEDVVLDAIELLRGMPILLGQRAEPTDAGVR